MLCWVLVPVVAAGLGLAMTTPTWAAAPVVAYVAVGGSDAAGCTSSAPCATVNAAVATVASGGTVYVGVGTFAGPVNILGGETVDIAGAGATNTILSGHLAGPVVSISPGASATLSGLTVTQGVGDKGGGVVNNGTANLDHVRVAFNLGTYGGGGVWNGGRLTVTDSEIIDNTADGVGGGGLLSWGVRATISRSLIAQNTAENASGGGLANLSGGLTVQDSTITGNHAPTGYGGGINLVPVGAGVGLTLRHVTVSGNDARLGGGLNPVVTGNLTIDGSVFAGNLGGDCVAGIDDDITEGLFDSHYSMDSDGTCAVPGSGIRGGVDPQLSDLVDNGGPWPTEAIPTTSPAHEVIPAADPLCDELDQRAEPRDYPDSTGCDLGAYQNTGTATELISPASVAFGDGPAVAEVDITNSGTTPLIIGSRTFSDDVGLTMVPIDCPLRRAEAPGWVCRLQVSYNGAGGWHSARLVLTGNAGTGSQTILVTADGPVG
jgi:hypothetical protein